MLNMDTARMVFEYNEKLGLISLKDDDASLLFQFPGEYKITYILTDQLKN
jgi:hypothetical protein